MVNVLGSFSWFLEIVKLGIIASIMNYIIVAVVSKIVLGNCRVFLHFLDFLFLLWLFFSGVTWTACALGSLVLVVDGEISFLWRGDSLLWD